MCLQQKCRFPRCNAWHGNMSKWQTSLIGVLIENPNLSHEYNQCQLFNAQTRNHVLLMLHDIGYDQLLNWYMRNYSFHKIHYCWAFSFHGHVNVWTLLGHPFECVWKILNDVSTVSSIWHFQLTQTHTQTTISDVPNCQWWHGFGVCMV